MSPSNSPCSEIYLDANATTAILPAAREAVLRTLDENYGNPGSPHGAGLRARTELENARRAAATMLGLPPERLIFNSGATEGIQTSILSALCAHAGKGPLTVLYGATEHKAVPEAMQHWIEILRLQVELLAIPVDRDGRHDLQWLAQHARGAALVATMAANNETGCISDLAGIAAVLDALPQRPLWLVDGVQAFGKLQPDWLGLRADYVPMSGHKLHAPKGTGLLYVREGAPFTRLLAGGGQEGNTRCGTENLPGIAALGAVCAAVPAGRLASLETLAAARERLLQSLQQAFPTLQLNSPAANCLPTTLNFSIEGLPSKRLLELFDAAGLRLSAGSACNSKAARPSHVLLAMGLGEARAASAIRLSLSPMLNSAEIDEACRRIAQIGQIWKSQSQAILAGDNVELPAQDAALCEARSLTADRLSGWLHRHPAARLIDIREAWEQDAAIPCPALDGIRLLPRPLSRLKEWQGELHDGQAVLLCCRSGRRSGQLLTWLHNQGRHAVWHLADGLAGLPQTASSFKTRASNRSLAYASAAEREENARAYEPGLP
jgi:cysteine sulfinate desulfinase/cysteine desulfurase-like protein/rhodanese-related sulfurtransferase